jgi:WS/DGAT/MGAT family acyltransferase
VRRVKDAHGVKVNDVVIALCASALRRYLLEREELPEQPLTTGVPISTRAEGDTTQDNQVSFMFVNMATHLADPVERLRAIAESGGSAKQMAKALGARQIQSLGEVAAPLILSGAIKAAYRGQLMTRSPLSINTLVSNVPGPPVPLYLSGARVAGIYPCSVILEGMGLNFTVLSNVDRIDVGLHVDPDLIPDPWAISQHIPAALDELLAASGLDPATPVPDPFEAPAGTEAEAAGSEGERDLEAALA